MSVCHIMEDLPYIANKITTLTYVDLYNRTQLQNQIIYQITQYLKYMLCTETACIHVHMYVCLYMHSLYLPRYTTDMFSLLEGFSTMLTLIRSPGHSSVQPQTLAYNAALHACFLSNVLGIGTVGRLCCGDVSCFHSFAVWKEGCPYGTRSLTSKLLR